jgi:hypothetical protein
MANQMIALQARGPQLPDPSKLTAQYANMMNMTAQRRTAERQGMQAQQAMDINAAQEERAAALHTPALAEAGSKATSAMLKTAMEFNNYVRNALSVADTPDQVVELATRIARQPQFQDEMFQGALSEAVASMPRDPALFEPWKKKTALSTLEADKRYASTITQQNLGTSTRLIRTSNLGGGPAEVVEGSQAAIDIKPTVVNVEGIGPVIVDPNTGMGYPAGAGGIGDYKPPRTGGIPTGAPGQGNTADVVYGFGKFGSPSKPLSTLSIGEVQDFQRNTLIPKTRGKVGAGPDMGTGAVGTYQFTYGTLQEIAPKVLGPNWRNTTFTPDVQEQLAKALYEERKGGNLKDTWAGLPSNRPGQYTNVPWEQVRDKIIQVESGGGPRRGAGTPTGAGTGTPKTFQQLETEKGFKKTLDLFDYNAKTGENSVSKLIEASTSGGLEKIGSDIVGFFGEATPGRVALGELASLKDNMTFEKLRGKLGAQISDADVRLVASTMGDIANADIPANERLAKWENVVLPILMRGAGMTYVKPKAGGGGSSGSKTPTKKPPLKDIFR